MCSIYCAIWACMCGDWSRSSVGNCLTVAAIKSKNLGTCNLLSVSSSHLCLEFLSRHAPLASGETCGEPPLEARAVPVNRRRQLPAAPSRRPAGELRRLAMPVRPAQAGRACAQATLSPRSRHDATRPRCDATRSLPRRRYGGRTRQPCPGVGLVGWTPPRAPATRPQLRAAARVAPPNRGARTKRRVQSTGSRSRERPAGLPGTRPAYRRRPATRPQPAPRPRRTVP